jgi:ubiquinone biosynthesis protein
MTISLNPRHLKRYAQLAKLLAKYGRSDIVRQSGLDAALDDEAPEVAADGAQAEQLAADLEALGPTFIKLGQLLSSRADLLPAAYTESLSRLQEDVEGFSFEDVERILEEELGIRASKAFAQLDPKPLAAASLGQVHRATLPSGRLVAVKVQRPGIREQVIDDFEVLAQLAAFLDQHTETGERYRFQASLAEMRRSIMGELDYRKEAANLGVLGNNLAGFEHILVPCAVKGYVTSRVLTMDYVSGRSIGEVSRLRLMELDGSVLADELFRAYLKQVLVDGFFHSDPHPGNVFLTDDDRISLLDVGMVGRLPTELQDGVLRILLAVSEGKGRTAADVAIDMGDRTQNFDGEGFREEIGRQVLDFYAASMQDLQIGRVMMDLTRAAGQHGLIMPAQLTMLGKTLLNLDLIGRTLDPDFQPNLAIQSNAAQLMRQRMVKSASPGNVLASLLETNEFVQRLPGRLNRVFDALSEREVEVKVRVANDTLMLAGLQKIANRIAAGAVLAALIVSAAMLMQVETTFRIMGYPGLAMLLFIAAAAGAIILFFDVLSHDRAVNRSANTGPK